MIHLRHHRSATVLLLSLALFVLFPSCAFADVGVPLIAVTFPSMILALIPIVILESLVLARVLGYRFPRMIVPTLIANLASTLIGIPFAWLVQLIIGLCIHGFVNVPSTSFWGKVFSVTVEAAWLTPYEDKLYWMIPTACIFSMIPAFFLSVLIEYGVIIKLYDETTFLTTERDELKRGVTSANVASYGLLFLASIIWLIVSIIGHTG